jgi:hypothetical protein
MPTRYVADYAGVINDIEENSLNGVLQELEQRTGAQYIVLTVRSTKGVPIEQYAIELAEGWKLGQKGKDNGLLFVLAEKDKRYRFEVGYGLEGFVTDQYCGRVGRDVLVPLLRGGKTSQAIYQANLEVVRKIAKEAGVTLTGMPKAVPGPIVPQRRARHDDDIRRQRQGQRAVDAAALYDDGRIRRDRRLRKERLIRRRQFRRRVRRIWRRYGRRIRRRRGGRKLVKKLLPDAYCSP